MPRTTMNSINAVGPIPEQALAGGTSTSSTVPNTPQTPSNAPSTRKQNPAPMQSNPVPNQSRSNSNSVPVTVSLSESQFSHLLGNSVRQESRSTFSSCSARFNGGRSTAKVEDFIATILVYKEAENMSDSMALLSLPLLLEGYASSWWQGVKFEAGTFSDAIALLRDAFSPPKPDWRIYSEIFQDKQRPYESTDSFVCRKRSLFAQLKERLPESTIINMIFSQISIQIREKIPRESVKTFQELLYKARDIELSINENKTEGNKTFSSSEKPQIRCSYCRKKNHTADVCYKRIEIEKRGKPEENKINCYGCGAVGYYRSNCPTCNNRNILESPKTLDFNSIQTTLVGHDVPTVEINVNGLNGEAYLDTAARTSVAGYYLFQKLVEKEVKFQKVFAEITLADGAARKEVVCSTIVDIIIGKRLKRIRFICLPNARCNRTLLGIDFLEQAGIVMDLAQRVWYFKDEPKEFFKFKTKTVNVKGIAVSQAHIEDAQPKSSSNLQDFMSWFESNCKENPPLGELYSKPENYSPGGLFKIFEDSLPNGFEMPQSADLFPPLKKTRKDSESWSPLAFELNSLDFNICEDENSYLVESQKRELLSFLTSHEDIFENISSPINGITHKINTGGHTPISNPPYRISPAMKEKLKMEINSMLTKGIIEEVESPWAFPVVLIPKKDGSIRFCVDYRKLNAITVTDTYPLPRMEDLLHAAKTTPFMSTLDLKSGYWQIRMSEDDKLKTAFTTPFGIFAFNRMPFGLKNAPATFQRIIDKFRSSLPSILILAYLDDIIICSQNFASHIKDLDMVFKKLKFIGFHLNKDKCFFAKPEVKYLGHILTQGGIKIDPEKSSAILNRPIPKNVKQLMSFLQTCSWFRRFIPDFAKISKPLSNLTKKLAVWKWSEEENKSFEKLKRLLSSPPILQQVKENQPFFLRTDASNYAIGAVLLQGEKEDEQHPIEYASRLLLPAERNYSTTEREALAVVWAVQKFRGYIEGSEVSILTDHQPLKWLFSLKSPTGRLARWSLLLQSYNFTINYTPGRQNVIADTLSRPPCSHEVCIESCECNAIDIDLPRKGLEDFRQAQLEDDDLRQIITSFEKDDENVLRHTNRGYMMLDGVLYRYCCEQDSENGQLVLPKSLRDEILYKYHKDAISGHYGKDKTTSRITALFYWPGIRNDIGNYVKSCEECKRYKPSNMKPSGLLQTISTNKRFEIIAVDLFGPLPRTIEGYQWILIVEDICSRWVELFALKDATAENCAITLLNEVVLRYGVPRRIHTDNGTQFISALMQKLTFCLGIKQTFTPIYHPQSNPVERKNRDLKAQLSICVGTDHKKWSIMLPAIRFAMNTAKCDSTGQTAAYLTFGRELRTPTEVHYDFRAIVKAENFVPQITPYLLKLADTLEIANETQIKMQDKNKRVVDLKRKSQPDFQVGCKVLAETHILSKAKDSITSKFVPKRDGPYVIIAKKGSNCYSIAAINEPNLPVATVHSSALIPYEGEDMDPVYPKRKRGRPSKESHVQHKQQHEQHRYHHKQQQHEQHRQPHKQQHDQNSQQQTEKQLQQQQGQHGNQQETHCRKEPSPAPRRSARLAKNI